MERIKKAENVRELKEKRHAYCYPAKALPLRCEIFLQSCFICNLDGRCYHNVGVSLVAQMVKNLPAMWETGVWSPSQEDPLEEGQPRDRTWVSCIASRRFTVWATRETEGMATHSWILAWRIPWTEEPGGPQSMGSQRVRHDWVTNEMVNLFIRYTFYFRMYLLIMLQLSPTEQDVTMELVFVFVFWFRTSNRCHIVKGRCT